MPVRRRGKYWQVDFRVGARRVRFNLGPEVTTRRQAQEQEALARAQAVREAAGPPGEGEALPRAAFSGFAKRWLADHVGIHCKPSVYRRYESIIRIHLLPLFGDREISTITRRDVELALADWTRSPHPDTGKPLSAKTCNEHVGVLSSMLEAAVRWDYLRSNPCRGVKRLRMPPPPFAFYDAEQSVVFLDACRGIEPDWYPFFLTALRTGLRLGELLALEWGDVDFRSRTIVVRHSFTRGETTTPKSGRFRNVPMSGQVASALRGARHLRGPLVFCRPDGRHLTRDVIKHPFARVVKAADLPTIRLHDLRHSFASQLVMAGRSLSEVRELLGHADTKMTLRYAHLSSHVLADAVDVLDRADADTGTSTRRRAAWSRDGHRGRGME